MKFKHKTKLKFKIYSLAIIAIAGIFIWFNSGRSILEFFFASLLLGWIISSFGTIGTHRWLSHRSFEPTVLGRYLMMLGMIVESYGKPSQMVITHRLHHKYTDQPGDPHSPKFKSFFEMWRGDFDDIISLPPIKDFLRIKEIVWFDKHYWKLWWAFNLILAVIDWQLALIFCPLIFTRTWVLSTVVNYHAHSGKLAIPKNLNPVLSYLSTGEGLHKNHHEQPSNWRFDRPGETLDTGAVLVKYLLMKV
jgi:stearoyl-CoA desaturase (delta-9 desaturase)